jgi:hypothetical protein
MICQKYQNMSHHHDSKSELNEICQRKGWKVTYNSFVSNRTRNYKCHAVLYTSDCGSISQVGEHLFKKIAEQRAAQAILEEMDQWTQEALESPTDEEVVVENKENEHPVLVTINMGGPVGCHTVQFRRKPFIDFLTFLESIYLKVQEQEPGSHK